MRVLVTGGAGYIGSVVTSVLLERGHEVTVLDDLSTGHADAVPSGATFIQGRIQDAADVIASGLGFDGLLHFAAKSLVGESMADPALYWQGNVVASAALFDAARAHGLDRIVFSSTAATYGEPIEQPILETAPTRPTNPYGASKLAIDTMLTGYCQAYGLGAISLRYFNVAGAAGPFGERHATETHLIPLALQVASGTRPALAIFGTDYPTPDGTCVRDYIHVLDLADAHVRALEAVTPGEHRIYNLGSGSGYSVHEVLDAVRAVTGHPIPAGAEARRIGDPPVLVAGNARASADLGWQPSRSLTEMVQDAWTFAQSR